MRLFGGGVGTDTRHGGLGLVDTLHGRHRHF